LSYDIQLHGLINSDWAESADNISTSWICFSLSSATISWDNMKHKYLAVSTAEAKYIVACDVCIEAMWLLKPVSRLFDHVLDSTVIYCDNQSCVKLSKNLVFHDRLNHIEIKYYFLRDKVQRGEVVL
jgi:hypothetical protein